MALQDYEKKREFDKTPEPGVDAHARPAGFTGPVFCIQRHDARRLHYDLRIEIGGTHSGLVSATMNTVGQFGAILSPIILAWIVQRSSSWTLPLQIMAGLFWDLGERQQQP